MHKISSGDGWRIHNTFLQVGAFYTFSRDHSARGTAPQELYLWESVTIAAKNALEMRYQLLPYLYSLFYAAHTTGSNRHRAEK